MMKRTAGSADHPLRPRALVDLSQTGPLSLGHIDVVTAVNGDAREDELNDPGGRVRDNVKVPKLENIEIRSRFALWSYLGIYSNIQ